MTTGQQTIIPKQNKTKQQSKKLPQHHRRESRPRGNPPPRRGYQRQRGGEDNDVYGPLACHKRQGHRGGEDSEEYSLASYGSGHTANRETNLLARAQQCETQDEGRATHGANRRGGQPPQRVLGGILNKIDNKKPQGKQKGIPFARRGRRRGTTPRATTAHQRIRTGKQWGDCQFQ